jgi:hypothetical protein
LKHKGFDVRPDDSGICPGFAKAFSSDVDPAWREDNAWKQTRIISAWRGAL